MFSAPHALFKYGLLVVYNDLCGRGSDVLRLRSAPTDAHLKCFIILFCKLGAAIRCLFISVLIFAKLKKNKDLHTGVAYSALLRYGFVVYILELRAGT